MTDLPQIDDLLRRAKGEERFANETGDLIREAWELFVGKPAFGDAILTYLQARANEQAALHLTREALPGWSGSIDWERERPYQVELLWPPGSNRNGYFVEHDDFARCILIATLEARKAMVEG